MVSHVRLERVAMREDCLAQRTFEWSLPRVTPEVSQKVAGFCEDFVAKAADVGLAQPFQFVMIYYKTKKEYLANFLPTLTHDHSDKMVVITGKMAIIIMPIW